MKVVAITVGLPHVETAENGVRHLESASELCYLLAMERATIYQDLKGIYAKRIIPGGAGGQETLELLSERIPWTVTLALVSATPENVVTKPGIEVCDAADYPAHLLATLGRYQELNGLVERWIGDRNKQRTGDYPFDRGTRYSREAEGLTATRETVSHHMADGKPEGTSCSASVTHGSRIVYKMSCLKVTTFVPGDWVETMRSSV